MAVPHRDMYGHGSHTSGIAAGNYGAPAPYYAKESLLSGMAPRARLAVYKVSMLVQLPRAPWGFGALPVLTLHCA